MIVADSDVLIDFLRGRGELARRVALELETRSFATTAITAFELRSGAGTKAHKQAVEALLEAMTILPFGDDESRIAAEIRLAVEGAGQHIGMADYLIAAVCIAADGVLLTRNPQALRAHQGIETQRPHRRRALTGRLYRAPSALPSSSCALRCAPGGLHGTLADRS